MAPPPPPPPPPPICFPFTSSKKPRRRLSWSNADPPSRFPAYTIAQRPPESPTSTISTINDGSDRLSFDTHSEDYDVPPPLPEFSSRKKEKPSPKPSTFVTSTKNPPPPPPPPPICLPFVSSGKKGKSSLKQSDTMTGTEKPINDGSSNWGYGWSVARKRQGKDMETAQTDSLGSSRTVPLTSRVRRDDRDEYSRLTFHTDSEKYDFVQTHPESPLQKIGKRSVEQSNTSAATKKPNTAKGSKWGLGLVIGKKQKEEEAQANFVGFPETGLPLYEGPYTLNQPTRSSSQQRTLPLYEPPPIIPAPNPPTRSDSQSTTASRTQASQAELERNEREVREEARRREEEWRRREREAMRKEEDARRREEDARRKEERLKRKEEEARRKEEEFRLKQKEAERQAEDFKLQQQEARRQEEEVRRREEELRRREEELWRRESEIAARQRADPRKREEVDRREGENYHPETEEQWVASQEDQKIEEREMPSSRPEETDRLASELHAHLLIEAKAEEERRDTGVQHRDPERGKADEIWRQKQIEQAKGKQRSPSGYQSRIPYSTHAWDTCRPSIFSVRTSMSSYQSSFQQADVSMMDWQRRQEEVYRKQQEQFCKERERLESLESS